MADAPLIWGLDISKRRNAIAHGYAGAIPTVVSVDAGKEDDIARAAVRLFVYLRDLMRVGRPDAIFYERPLEHGFEAKVDFDARTVTQRRGIIAAFNLAKIAHTVELFAGLASIPCYSVSPATARKEFIGDGRLKRDAAKLRVRAMCEVLGWPVENDDESDACCIWHTGVVKLAPRLAAPIHPGLWMKAATRAAGRNPAVFADLNDEVPW
jgi:hypothetical protein